MTDLIESTEPPNWMKELEAKREHRLKARLGHESGAGAPCLTCDTKCPGLDLHFWRKICKNCKCAKENHDVHDDDIYGLAQFHLLGSKPRKARKFVLPGKKEVDLDWVPSGPVTAVDKYLKTLPPELLPIKGSAAALERKQLLQKQIPIYDIDPSLCHELSEAESKQMNEYVAHIKQHSVGIGRLIQLDEGVGVQNCKFTGKLPNLLAKNSGVEEFVQNPQVFRNTTINFGDQNTNVENSTGNFNSGGKSLPHYAASNFNRVSETRRPQKIDNIRDLAFSTYDPSAFTVENDVSTPNHNYDPPSIENLNIYEPNHLNVPENVQNPAQISFGKTLNPQMHKQKPPNFQPSQLYVPEHVQNPSYVPVGLIHDIEYSQSQPETNVPLPPDANVALPEANTYTPYAFADLDSNKRLFSCHRCKKPFRDDEVVIGIDRSDALYHSSCFKCSGCNQSLADLVYFYDKENDDIFCGRDYAKIRGIPRCKACDELIFVKEYTLAEHCTFHVKHFCCFVCDMPLADQKYVIDETQPFCLPCYEAVKADRCNTCERVIKPDEEGANLMGVHFHATDGCFACQVCGKPLLGEKFLFRGQKLYCSAVCFGNGN